MAETIRVENKTARPLVITGAKNRRYRLSPGFGEVPADIFREALRYRTTGANGEQFNILEKKRELGELDWEGDEEEAAPPPSKPINELPERSALKLIRETHDPSLLSQYKTQDTRPRIQKAIDEKTSEVDRAVTRGKAEGKGMADTDEKASE